LPYTYLNSVAITLFGTESPAPYRLVAALLGTLTIPLLFFGARGLLGPGIALTAAALLAFSEWHIHISRTARMYGPLLFFVVAFSLCALHWVRSREHRYLV